MIEINLLSEGKKKKEKKGLVFKAPNVVIVAIVIVVIEVVALFVASYSMNRTIDNLKEQRNKLSVIERKVKRIKIKIREVRNMIKAVKNLEKNRGEAAKILEEVADAIPKGMYLSNSGYTTVAGSLWLTKLTKKGSIISLEGKSFSAEAVADYMMNLESIEEVQKVRFAGGGLRKIYNKGGIDVYAFSIVVTLKG